MRLEPVSFKKLPFPNASNRSQQDRSVGFGNGEQIIHEVLPPLNNEERLILNLRMRKNVLPSPKEFEIKNEMQKRNTRINI
jgi:hypothetical protein